MMQEIGAEEIGARQQTKDSRVLRVFLIIWVVPYMVVPPKRPKMIILVGKTMVVGYHHFRKPPYVFFCRCFE